MLAQSRAKHFAATHTRRHEPGTRDQLEPGLWRRAFEQYQAAPKAAGLRYIKLHGLRHGGGSLVARETDAVFVQHFLGHAKLSTTERYMHAKARHADAERLNRAFGAPATAETG